MQHLELYAVAAAAPLLQIVRAAPHAPCTLSTSTKECPSSAMISLKVLYLTAASLAQGRWQKKVM